MHFFRYGIFVVLFSLPFHVFAFDPSCFREKADIMNDSSVRSLQVAVDSLEENVYFIQDGTILPSRIISTDKNPPIRYTLTGMSMIDALRDFDSKTFFELDPFVLSQRDIVLTLDLGRLYPKGTMNPYIDYTTHSRVRFEISEDGLAYFGVERLPIADFSLRFIRITFEKTQIQGVPTVIRSIDFFENVNMRFLVVPQKVGPIVAYRGQVCDPKGFLTPGQSLQGDLISGVYMTGVFMPNPLYKNDYDQDGIENISDVCPYIADRGQKDRNFDGRGDACSDDDNDGISGDNDNCPTMNNADQKDINVNNIGDVCEFDTDNDGVPDGIDNAIHTSNPDQKDTDRDSIGDIIDNCDIYNPDQLDLDKNTIGDTCDRDTEYRKVNDEDQDGVLDFSDNCRYIPNSDQRDTDMDGRGDVCDNCISIQNLDQKDIDANGKGDMCDDIDTDGIEGWRDNCPTMNNVDQKDANNDTIGDVCSDTDGDTLFDPIDNCPTSYNPNQENIDKDEKGDICDTEDNRFIESNKYFFMVGIAVFSLIFIGGILFLLRKIRAY